MTKIAIIDDYQNAALAMADWRSLPAETEITVFNDALKDLDALAARLEPFEILCIMRERTAFPAALLERLPNLKLVVTSGSRNAAVDLEATERLGIMVSGTFSPGTATAELSWGLIIAVMRNIPREDHATREGHWQTGLGRGLDGKTLGVLGLGRHGSRVARVGNAFDMNVIAWSQNLTEERAAECGATRVTKDELFEKSDVISIHVVLGERTRGLVGARELGLMKATSYLVNTSRAPIVDEEALIAALESGGIAGAAMDVYNEEPLPLDHPLRRTENTVITPHVGYITEETYRVFYAEMVEDILAYLAGDPIRVITPPKPA